MENKYPPYKPLLITRDLEIDRDYMHAQWKQYQHDTFIQPKIDHVKNKFKQVGVAAYTFCKNLNDVFATHKWPTN